MTIAEYFGNVASQDPRLSACVVTVTAACEEAYQTPEFTEYVLVLSGLFVLHYGDSKTVVARQGEGMIIPAGTRMKVCWPGPCTYIPICMPAFSPAICHREEGDVCVKDEATIKRLNDLHGHSGGAREGTASAVVEPAVFKSADVVVTPSLVITEYHGAVASQNLDMSACLASVTTPCEEAYQAPEFDEYVLVLAGTLVLRHGADLSTEVKAGEGVLLKAGERVKWTWPGPCQYVPICLPAFTPANCRREPEEGAIKDAEVMQRLHDLHSEAKPKEPACKFRRADVRVRDLASLPKAELHVHLEGAMRPETLTELCAKYGLQRPMDTRSRRFEDFSAFADVYIAACGCLREESDIFRLVRELAEDVKAYGGIWVEAHLSSFFYAEPFGGLEAVFKLLLRAAEAAEDATGVGIGFIVSAERNLAVEESAKMAEVVRSLVEGGSALIRGRLGIVGFGLHGNEEGFPPAPFADTMRRACVGGVVPVPHAGELPPVPGGGAASVRFCVDELGSRRIGHGVLAAEDDALVAHLAASGVCLDVCPTSNYLLRVVDSLGEHPLPRLLAAGVACSISSDDPLLFGCNLLSEFAACRREMGLSDAELAACARTSFVHSRAPEDVKARGLEGVTAWLAS